MTINRKHRDYLEDIAGEIRKVAQFIKEISFEQFRVDEKTVYAVIRAIEIIGEASKKVPDEIKQIQPTVPWREISGMRDKLVHDYSGVNLTIVWKTATEDLLEIEPLILELLSQ
jgi:uncharacterized protein with HEPN domain